MGDVKYSIVIIGAGKVGTALGALLIKKGHRVDAAVARNAATLEKAAPLLPGARLLTGGVRELGQADVIFITTNDGEIRKACDDLAKRGTLLPKHTVIHTSGAGPLELLSSARSAGAQVASLHPIQSFASVELALKQLPGSYFGLTAEGPARDVALRIVDDLGGIAVDVADKDKALYHAAACVASNYLVALLQLAQQLYKAAGFSGDAALKAMMPLVKGTLSNIEGVGTVAALTGPIARGDVTIIKQHLNALNKLSPDMAELYKALGLRTAGIAAQKGTLKPEKAKEVIALLKDGGC